MKAFVRYNESIHTFTLCLDIRKTKIEIGDLSEEATQDILDKLSQSFMKEVKFRRSLEEKA